MTAVAASTMERASAYAAQHGVPVALGDYGALIARDDVDVVYNALPPGGHLAWTVKALAAGKHVLCEKPFAMNADEARLMVDAGERSGRRLIEAFHYLFHPLFVRVLQLVSQNVLGRLHLIEACVDVIIVDRPGQLRYDPAVGGGGLMDLGCYAVHWARTIAAVAGRGEPEVVSAKAREIRPGVDVEMSAVLRCKDGLEARIGCAMEHQHATRHHIHLRLVGEKGEMAVENPMLPQSGNKLTLKIDGNAPTMETFPTRTTYHYQLEHVLGVLAGTTPQVTGGIDAIRNMETIDAIYRAAGMTPRGLPS